jgi:hypothetical protein
VSDGQHVSEEQPEAGSQTAGAEATGAQGHDEDASGASEPKVLVGDREVPLSQVENALKVSERFTQTSQALSDKEKSLSAKEAEIRESEARMAAYRPVITAMDDPERYEALSGIIPDLPDPTAARQVERNTSLIITNADLAFKVWERDNPEFTDEQKHALKMGALDVIAKGQVPDGNVDFGRLAKSMFHDDIVAAASAKAAAQAIADAEAKAKGDAESRVLPPGQASAPRPEDIAKMSSTQKLAHAHATRK